MAKKFYFTSLASRPLTFSGRVFKFTVTSMSGGKACGVYEATDPEEIAILDGAVQARRGVREITAEAGDAEKKRVQAIPPSLSGKNSNPRIVKIPLLPQLAIDAPVAGSAADPAAGNGRPPSEIPPQPLPSIGSLLRIARVNPPKPFSGSEQKIVKASARADKAKIRIARRNAA